MTDWRQQDAYAPPASSDAMEVLEANKRKAPADSGTDGAPLRRTKKGRKGRRGGNGSGSGGGGPPDTSSQDFVAVSPLAPNSEVLQEGWRPVMLSKVDKAPQLTLGADRLSATSSKGYRMVRATHGVHEGSWYYEVRVTRLGATGHARLGWATRKAEIHAPVGYDGYGYAYRDLQGCKVHKALREEYGEPYREGDVIGCLIHMPPGGRPFERTRADARTYKGSLFVVEEKPEETPVPLEGALIAFSRNGVSQGVAFRNLLEGTHFPAVSLYTLPEQAEGASVTVNFGPEFEYAPPEIEGVPKPRPISDLAALETDFDTTCRGEQQQQQQKQQQQPAETGGKDSAAAAAAAAAAEKQALASAGTHGHD